MAKASFLEALEAATKEDLEAIEVQVSEHEAKATALRSAARILKAKLGVDEPKPPKAPRANGNGEATDDLKDKRKRVNVYLRANGAKSTQKISESLAISRMGRNALGQVLAHEWFHVNS